MTRRQENRIVTHINRLLIAVISLIGMMLNGTELADLILELAIIFWLWMPEFHALEITALHRLHLH